MKITPLLLTLCIATIPGVRAQTTVFNDTFGAGSTINSNPTSPAAPTLNKTAYQQLSAKTFYPDPPTIASGSLRYGIINTASGFNSIEALFTQYPVTLTNTGDYIEMTVVFTNEANLMNAANGTLFFGLHNSGQVQPIPGGMNGNILNPTIGYAQNWQGYRSAIMYTAGSHSIATRPAQTVVATNNQDVLSGYSGAVNIATATSTLAAFTPGQQYTAVLRITKTGASALTLVSTLYQGANTSGTQLFTQTGTTSSILTATYDALGIGYQAVSGATIMAVNSIQIITTAPVPLQITSQPSPTNQSVLVGDSVTYSVAATGGAATSSYQWQKSSNGGGTYTNITGATGTSYSIAGAASTDSGMYRVQVTNGAEQITSNAVTLTVAAPSAPQITAQPSNTTVASGSSASFTVQVSGNPQPAVQWQKSTDNGATFSNVGSSSQTSPNTYTIPGAQASDAGLYRAVATNSQGSATSTAASLTVTGTSTDYYVDPSGQTVGSYTTVTLAMQAVALATPAPTATKRAHVYIAPGIYNEQPSLSTPYVSLIGTGASAHDVVITFPGVPNVPPASFGATLTVARQATAFMATNITFENATADQDRTQALALRDSADLTIYYRCRFLGYQDTILLDQLSRHYFLECFITGDTDYIYGNGIMVFDKCLIQNTWGGYVTAVNTEPTTATGVVLFDCTLVAGVDRNYPADNTSLPPANNTTNLGRPWQWTSGSRASVVYIRTKMAPHITAKGWDRWNGSGDANYPNGNLTPDTNTRYAEFGSMDLHGTPLPLNAIPPTRAPNDTYVDPNDGITKNNNDADPTGSTRVGVPVGRCGWEKAMTAAQAANYTLDNIFGPAAFWNTPGRQPDGFREAAANAINPDPATVATFQYTDPVVAGRPATWDPKTQLLLLPR